MSDERIPPEIEEDGDAPTHYTSLRLSVYTHRSLTEYRNRLQASVDVDPLRYPYWLRQQITLGGALSYLLYKQNNSLRRCRKRRKLASHDAQRQTGPANGSEAGAITDGRGDDDTSPLDPSGLAMANIE